MNSFFDQPPALFAALVSQVRQDPWWWGVFATLIALCALGYATLLLTAVSLRVARLQRQARRVLEQEAHGAAEHLAAIHYYMRDLDEKLGSSLPRDVKVGSIRAENLVVQPGNGERLRDFR
jgi:hypothetical protein